MSELVKAESGGLVTADHFQQYAGEGMHDLDGIRLSIPSLHLCQAQSPEVIQSEKAKAGQFVCRSAPGHDKENPLVLDEPVLSVCQARVRWVLWPRNDDGERPANAVPVWSHDAGAIPIELAELCRWGENGEKPAANETISLLCLPVNFTAGTPLNPAAPNPVLLNFDRSQFRPAKNFLAAIKQRKFAGANGEKFTPPIWANVVKLTSAKETGGPSGNQTWRIPVFTILNESLAPELVAAARSLADQSKSSW